jgi:acyl-coenzyme A synthetase/AMP-(fatty) acid ligase
MQAFHDVAQYRIVQEDKKRINVHLVKGKEFNDRTPALIKEEIKKVTGHALKVEVQIFKELDRDESGKIRTVVSRVIPDMQERISL